MPGDDPVTVGRELTVGDVQVGPADATGFDADEDLTSGRHRYRAPGQPDASTRPGRTGDLPGKHLVGDGAPRPAPRLAAHG